MPDTRQALEAVKAALAVLGVLLGVVAIIAGLILAGAVVVGLGVRLALWAAGA